MSTASAAILIFLVIDPIGNSACFLCALKNIDPKRHRRIIFRELLFALLVLTVFLFSGQLILDLMHISQSSLGIAGGIILFLIAIKMIYQGAEEAMGGVEGEPFLVPLAVPLLAGPSAMAVVILIMASDPTRWLSWFAALLMAWSASCAIILCASPIKNIFGEKGLTAIERLMGMLLTVVAVEMLVQGIREAFFRAPIS